MMETPQNKTQQTSDVEVRERDMARYQFRAKVALAGAVILSFILAGLIGLAFWALATGLGNVGKYAPID